MLDFGVPVAAGSVGGLEQLEVAIGSEPTVEAVDHAARSEVCNTVSSSPSSRACGHAPLAGRCHVDAIDETAQQRAVRELDFDALLAALRVESGGVLEAVIARQQCLGLLEQLGPQRRFDAGGKLRLCRDDPLPRGV